MRQLLMLALFAEAHAWFGFDDYDRLGADTSANDDDPAAARVVVLTPEHLALAADGISVGFVLRDGRAFVAALHIGAARWWHPRDKTLNVTYKLPPATKADELRAEDVLTRGEVAASGQQLDPTKAGATRPPISRFGFADKSQKRRHWLAWTFNLLLLAFVCTWLLVNLLVNPEKASGGLQAGGMSDGEWRATIVVVTLLGLPQSFLLLDGLKALAYTLAMSPQVMRHCAPHGTRRRYVIGKVVRAAT